MHMKKRLITLAGSAVVAAVAVYTATSWYVGQRIQEESSHAVQSLNAHLAKTWSSQVQIQLQSYQAGVYQSRAQYALTLPSNDEKNSTILIANQIDHGPLDLSALLSGHWKPLLAHIHSTLIKTPFTDHLFQLTQGKSALDGQTRITFDGVAHVDWNMLPLDLTHEGIRSVFAGATLTGKAGPALSWVDGELDVPSLVLDDGSVRIEIDSSRIHANTRVGSFGLNIGESGASILRLKVTRPEAPSIEINKLASRFMVDESGPLINGEIHYDIQQLKVNDKDWGEISFAAYLDKLNGDATKSLIDLYNRILSRSIDSPDESLVQNTDIRQFWLSLHALLKNNPDLRIQPLRWTTPDGESMFNLSARLTQTALKPGGVGLDGNPFLALQSTLSVSRSMISGLVAYGFENEGLPHLKARERAMKEIQSIVGLAARLKLVKIEGDKIISSLLLEKGQLKFNGLNVPTEAVIAFYKKTAPAYWLSLQAASQAKPQEPAPIAHLNPSDIAIILTSAGFVFEQLQDERGDPFLRVKTGDGAEAATVDIIFYGCGKDTTCQDILLKATFSPKKPVALKVMNDWNAKNRWGRAFVNDKGLATIEMDINAYGGIGRAALESMIYTFFDIVKDFDQSLDKDPSANNSNSSPSGSINSQKN